MSSQDSEGESYVDDYLADPKVYGEVEHCGWTTEEEEDYEPKGKEGTTNPRGRRRRAQMKMKHHYLNLGTCTWS